MSKIHYFQRFHQKENFVTNNTLLLFSHLYKKDINRFEDFINFLITEKGIPFLEIGSRFYQQTGNDTGTSTPDGEIVQQSIKILIETKLYNNYDKDQLKRHLDGFKNEDSQLLFLINPTKPDGQFNLDMNSLINSYNKTKNKKIQYLAFTFKDIIEAIESVLLDIDADFHEILDDYREFCIEEGLMPREQYLMRAITSGATFDDNMKYNIYYDRADRGFSSHHFLGLYKNKAVRAIGELNKIIQADYDPNKKSFTKINLLKGNEDVTDSEKKGIEGIMNDAKQNLNWDIYNDLQFFLVEKFHLTDYKKSTKYPIRRTKFFDLGTILETETLPDCSTIADKLKEKTWE